MFVVGLWNYVCDVEYMTHICCYSADGGPDVGGEGCGSVVPATPEEVAHASAMRGLRQEAGDVEEAPLPEQEVVGDEKVAEKPEHEVAGSSMLQATIGRQPCVPDGLLSPSDYHVTGMRSQWACEFPNCRNAAVAECRGSCAYYMCTAHLDGSCGACGLAPMCDLCLVFHECSELQPVVTMRHLQ